METRGYTITKDKKIHDCHDCDYHSCYMDRDTVRLECSCHHPSLRYDHPTLGNIQTTKGVESGSGFPEWCPL